MTARPRPRRDPLEEARIQRNQIAATMQNIADGLEKILDRLDDPKVNPKTTIQNVIAHLRRDAGEQERLARRRPSVRKAGTS